MFQLLLLLLYQEETLEDLTELRPAGGADAEPHPDLRVGSSLGASSGRSGAEQLLLLLLLGDGQGAVHWSGPGESGLHPRGHQEVWHLLPLPPPTQDPMGFLLLLNLVLLVLLLVLEQLISGKIQRRSC